MGRDKQSSITHWVEPFRFTAASLLSLILPVTQPRQRSCEGQCFCRTWHMDEAFVRSPFYSAVVTLARASTGLSILQCMTNSGRARSERKVLSPSLQPNGAETSQPPTQTERPGVPDEVALRLLLAAVYFDIVGYSHMIRQDDVETVQRIKTLWALIGVTIKRYRGLLVQTAGDSLLAGFISATDAVRCAIEVQRKMRSHDYAWGPNHALRMRLRIGIDVGEAIVDGSDLHGDGVITAVRLHTICPPGGICISRTAHEYVRNRLDVQFEPLGAFELKNLSHPIEVLVLWPVGEVAKQRRSSECQTFEQERASVEVLTEAPAY